MSVWRSWFDFGDVGVLSGLLAKGLPPLLSPFAFDYFAAMFAAVKASDWFHGRRAVKFSSNAKDLPFGVAASLSSVSISRPSR